MHVSARSLLLWKVTALLGAFMMISTLTANFFDDDYLSFEPVSMRLEKKKCLLGPFFGYRRDLDFEFMKKAKFDMTAADNPNLRPGGFYRPSNCRITQKPVAVIIPFRNRTEQLQAQLFHLHPILQRQQLDYVIVVVEQAGNKTFNKATMMNVAYRETLRLYPDRQCFIFHDVDIFSKDDRGLYACRDYPMHVSEFLDQRWNATGTPAYYFKWRNLTVHMGGIVSIPKFYFEKINGYSNAYFGWGAEDDDLAKRFMAAKVTMLVPNREVDHLHFTMFEHDPDSGNAPRKEKREKLYRAGPGRRWCDGLAQLKYKLLKIELKPVFTHLLVEINEDEIMAGVNLCIDNLRKTKPKKN